MFLRFQNHIGEHLGFLHKAKVLIAISGGLDSVVLTHLCHKLNLDLTLAHCNFNLRGAESDKDEAFVSSLATDLDVELFIQSFETEPYAAEKHISIQMAARELRYQWFLELSKNLKYDYVLTAHHADDHLETFLINLSRGTGLDGLLGIPEKNDIFIRPLLPFSRVELETYASSNAIEWREDASNASTKYVRNRLRHDVVPVLKDLNPQLLQNFELTMRHLQGTKDIVVDAIASFKAKVWQNELNFSTLKIEPFRKCSNPKTYLFELLKDYNFTQWDDIVNLLDAQAGKQVFSNTHRLLKDRDILILTDLSMATEFYSTTISKEDTSVQTAFGELSFEQVHNLPSSIEKHMIFVDADTLSFPLSVRTWHLGDVFYPIGMTGKKKLSKYFKDEKMSLMAKEEIGLLCSGADIVWIFNKRADDRFKVNANTKNILKIELL